MFFSRLRPHLLIKQTIQLQGRPFNDFTGGFLTLCFLGFYRPSGLLWFLHKQLAPCLGSHFFMCPRPPFLTSRVVIIRVVQWLVSDHPCVCARVRASACKVSACLRTKPGHSSAGRPRYINPSVTQQETADWRARPDLGFCTFSSTLVSSLCAPSSWNCLALLHNTQFIHLGLLPLCSSIIKNERKIYMQEQQQQRKDFFFSFASPNLQRRRAYISLLHILSALHASQQFPWWWRGAWGSATADVGRK